MDLIFAILLIFDELYEPNFLVTLLIEIQSSKIHAAMKRKAKLCYLPYCVWNLGRLVLFALFLIKLVCMQSCCLPFSGVPS